MKALFLRIRRWNDKKKSANKWNWQENDYHSQNWRLFLSTHHRTYDYFCKHINFFGQKNIWDQRCQVIMIFDRSLARFSRHYLEKSVFSVHDELFVHHSQWYDQMRIWFPSFMSRNFDWNNHFQLKSVESRLKLKISFNIQVEKQFQKYVPNWVSKRKCRGAQFLETLLSYVNTICRNTRIINQSLSIHFSFIIFQFLRRSNGKSFPDRWVPLWSFICEQPIWTFISLHRRFVDPSTRIFKIIEGCAKWRSNFDVQLKI
jgi:hypothetical protein